MSMNWDIEELAHRAMGKTEEETDKAINDSEDIDDALYEKYEVSFDQYRQIVEDLLPFTPQIKSAIGGTLFHAFVDVKQSRAIVKIDAKVDQGA